MKQLLIMISCFCLFKLSAQPSDIHRRSLYHNGTQRLKLKYEYYYDYWAEKDIKHGRYTTWYKNGAVKFDGNYLNGVLDGSQKYYNKKGDLAYIVDWENGHSVKSSRYHKNNNILRTYIYNKDFGALTEASKFDKQGKLRCQWICEATHLKRIRYNSEGKVAHVWQLPVNYFTTWLMPTAK